MTVIFDTTAAPPGEGFELWGQASSQALQPVTLRRAGDRPFNARLKSFSLGSMQLFQMSADAHAASRSPAMIRMNDPESIQVMLQVSGRCAIEQDNRSAVTTSRQLISWQSSRPYLIDAQTPFEALILRCPLALFGPHADRIRGSTAVCFDGLTGVGRLMGQYLTGLLSGLEADALSDPSLGHVAESSLGLVQALHAAREEAGTGLEGGAAGMRRRIEQYIDARLADPTLDCARIAADNYISRSYLHKLFEAEQFSVREAVRLRRLERCRRDLMDPELRHESITCIFTRWGFVSAAHFSRSFRTAYGQSPSEFRRDCVVG